MVEKNTINHTKDPDFHLHDPRATQGTNREIINGLAAQIGKLGSEWDKAADHALKVEQIANKKAKEQIILFLDFDGAKKTMVDAIFHDAFNEFEKIENKIRGFGWGKYGCPCDGDDKILSETSLRGVNSPEVLKMMASYEVVPQNGARALLVDLLFY